MSIRFLLIAGFVILALARPQAQTSTAVAALAESSTLVATGRVTALESANDGVAIYTYVTLEVAEVLKDSGHGDGAIGSGGSIVLKQIGGVADDVGLHIDGQARFAIGEDVLVFLAARPRDRTLYTVGLAQGAWQLTIGLSGRLTALQAGTAFEVASLRTPGAGRLPATAGAQPFVTTPSEMAGDSPTRGVAAFTFLADGPARWHQADDGVSIPVDYATIPAGLPGDGLAALDGALGAWNGVGTTLRLDRGQTSAATCPASRFSGNGRIAFYWNDPCGEIGDGDTVTFGVGGGYFTSGSVRTVNGVVFAQFLQGIAILNNVGPHLTSSACLQDAATHVLGHAVGLGDSSDGTAVMFRTLRSSCSSGSTGLGSDDVAGLRAIYQPLGAGGQPPQAPTALTATVNINTVVLNWSPAPTSGVALSYIVEAGSSTGLANLELLTVPGTTPTLTVTAVPPGVYFVRVRARNSLGTSAPSPETVVSVGPCTLPGAPTGLSYTAVESLVSIAWTAPPGSVQGYLLSAGFGPGQSNALVAKLGPTPAFNGMAPPGNYYVRVQAMNACGVGPASADLLVTVQACTAPPSSPTNLRFTKAGNVVTLDWDAPASGQPPRYRLVVGSAAGGADLLVADTANSSPTLRTAAPNGTYFVKVQAVNSCGASPYSNERIIEVP